MLLTPSQGVIAGDTHRFRVVDCGRRFGKTTVSVEEIKGMLLVDRNSRLKRIEYLTDEQRNNIMTMSDRDEYRCRVNYWAETYRDARDIAWGMLTKELEPITIKRNESRLEIIVMNQDGNPAIVKLRGWESVESARGTKSDFDIFDEVAKYKGFWMYWEEVIRPTLTDYLGEAIFYSTPRGFNHFYDLYNLQDKDKEFKSFHFTSYDNPFLLKEEIDKAKTQMSEDRFAQEYLADFRKTEGLVYKEFNREAHVFTDSPVISKIQRLVSVDFGFTNPSAIYSIDVDSDRNYWITTEYYKTGKTTPELIDHVKSLQGHKCYPDPAEPDRIEEMRRAGINIQDVSKDIEAGINSVRELLKTGRLKIHSSCKNLISEFETYRYPDKKPGKNENEDPIKENDHAMDSIRYALHMQSTVNGREFAHVYIPTGNIPTNGITAPAPIHAPQKIAHVFRPGLR